MATKAEPESDFYSCCDYCGKIFPSFGGRGGYDRGPDNEAGEIWYYCTRHDCSREE